MTLKGQMKVTHDSIRHRMWYYRNTSFYSEWVTHAPTHPLTHSLTHTLTQPFTLMFPCKVAAVIKVKAAGRHCSWRSHADDPVGAGLRHLGYCLVYAWVYNLNLNILRTVCPPPRTFCNGTSGSVLLFLFQSIHFILIPSISWFLVVITRKTWEGRRPDCQGLVFIQIRVN